MLFERLNYMNIRKEYMALSPRAELFINRIKTGEIPKKFLTNHGENYTNGLEGIAAVRFEHYIVSCTYKLMRYRLSEEGRKYCG